MRMLRQQYFLVLCFLLMGLVICGQASLAQRIPLDTTYTIASTYQKLIKQYPDIRVVQPDAENIRQIFDVVYLTLPETNFGKRDLHVDVYAPKNTNKSLPAIVMIHGGGWRSGNKSLNTAMAQHLAKSGFVVISAEYRLSLEAKYPAAVHDLKHAIGWIRDHAVAYAIDTSRIAVAGYSAGGQLASLLGVTQRNERFHAPGIKGPLPRIRAVVDMDGLLDFTAPESLAVARNEHSADVSWLQGFHQDVPDRWKEASPLTWVDRNSPPFLFINSSQTRFHAGCATMVKHLNQYGIYNEVHQLENAPHSYWFFHPWFDPAMTYTVNFLNKVFSDK